LWGDGDDGGEDGHIDAIPSSWKQVAGRIRDGTTSPSLRSSLSRSLTDHPTICIQDLSRFVAERRNDPASQWETDSHVDSYRPPSTTEDPFHNSFDRDASEEYIEELASHWPQYTLGPAL
jgi:hypothetical protein